MTAKSDSSDGSALQFMAEIYSFRWQIILLNKLALRLISMIITTCGIFCCCKPNFCFEFILKTKIPQVLLSSQLKFFNRWHLIQLINYFLNQYDNLVSFWYPWINHWILTIPIILVTRVQFVELSIWSLWVSKLAITSK